MTKRIGHIWPHIINIDNIHRAIRNASSKKRHQKRVRRVLNHQHAAAKTVQRILMEGYNPSPYTLKTITDNSSGKRRDIHMPRFFPDQIIHWALIQQTSRILARGAYHHAYGSVPGKGTSQAQKTLRKWLDQHRRRTKWCLKLDVKKYYPSISNDILKAQLRRIIKDPHVLNLYDAIIDSADGLPIGNYTSQWLAHFYLQPLDHFIKQQLRTPFYIRYADDLVLLGPNKRALHRARAAIAEQLEQLGLEMKGNWQVFSVEHRPIDFLGLRFYRTHTTLRPRTFLRMMRRARRIARKHVLGVRDAQTVLSYWGWIKRSDSYRLYNEGVKPFVSVGQARRVVSENARQQVRNY